MIRAIGFVVLLLACSSHAQSLPLASGHWEGAAMMPGHKINFSLDLAQKEQGVWAGSMSFPDEKSSAMTLSGISVNGNSVAFQSPATSKFEATIAADGQTMRGTMQLASHSRLIQLKRVSAPVLVPITASTAITTELEGSWEGTLKYGKTWGEMTPPEGNTPEGASFGVRIRISTGSNGVGVGLISRMDEPAAEFPVDVLVQRGDEIRFEVFSAAVVFEGRLRRGELMGEWRQLGADPMPLTLTRVNNN